MDLFQHPEAGPQASNPKIILEVLVALAVIVGGFFLFKNYQQSQITNLPSTGNNPSATYSYTPEPTGVLTHSPTPSPNPIDGYTNPFK